MPNVALSGTIDELRRADMLQENLIEHVVPFTDLRVHDDLNANLPSTPASDDLGIVGGAHGSASPMVKSSSPSGTTVTQKARFQIAMQPQYIAAGRVRVKIHCRTEAVANASGTIDVAAHESDEEGGIGADLCTTNAQNINAIAWADQEFVLTASGLVVGDVLDILITVALDDTGGANAAVADIGKIVVRADIKG